MNILAAALRVLHSLCLHLQPPSQELLAHPGAHIHPAYFYNHSLAHTKNAVCYSVEYTLFFLRILFSVCVCVCFCVSIFPPSFVHLCAFKANTYVCMHIGSIADKLVPWNRQPYKLIITKMI